MNSNTGNVNLPERKSRETRLTASSQSMSPDETIRLAIPDKLESVYMECLRLRDTHADLAAKNELLETRLTQETLARAQDAFSSKLKIDTLGVEISRLTKALARAEGIGGRAGGQRNFDEERAQDRCREKGALTVQQKMDLVDEVARLDASWKKFQAVIEMIVSAVPELDGMSNQEVDLDINAIPTATQAELYNFVFKR
ncbi:hypothetical protein C8R46DRAFT_1353794 [Mycena filopes]|nr:hypothetical protein C8R46DRAFT_1353794 [Mycena filopes]